MAPRTCAWPCLQPHLCSRHLPALALTTLLAQGTEQVTRREGEEANYKFHVMRVVDFTCNARSKAKSRVMDLRLFKNIMNPKVESKGQTKEYGPAVNHLKSLWT